MTKAQALLLATLLGVALSVFGFVGYQYLSMPAADRLYFSFWDGSSPVLIDYAKAQHPKQHIKHLKTYYHDAGNHYRVVMDYETYDHAGAYVVQLIGTLDKQTHEFKKMAIEQYE